MRQDILFLFYSNFGLCQANLKRLRRLNPDVKIFAYYTGSPENRVTAAEAVEGFVDDYYAFPFDRPARWRWQHFDQMLVVWFEKRGRELEWDTVFLVQWDMLVAAPIQKIYPELMPNQALLTPVRCMSEIEDTWFHAQPENSDLQGFRHWLKVRFGYNDEIYATPVVIAGLPRCFFVAALDRGYPETGYIEYTLPTMMYVYGIEVAYDTRYEVWWNPESVEGCRPVGCTVSVDQVQIPRSQMYEELSRADGNRIFHPIVRPIPSFAGNQIAAWALAKFFVAYERSPLNQVHWDKVRRLPYELYASLTNIDRQS